MPDDAPAYELCSRNRLLDSNIEVCIPCCTNDNDKYIQTKTVTPSHAIVSESDSCPVFHVTLKIFIQSNNSSCCSAIFQ
jgi:hypothetical protein